MLNEAPKKQKKAGSAPTKWKLFWLIQKESWRRMVTPYLMYFFMSLIMLAAQAIDNIYAKVIIGILCILAGAFFNGHLMYNCGALHYSNFVSGEIRRRNELFGIASEGSGHRVETEYRPWKGFYIGFLVGIPVIILGALSGRFYDSMGGNFAQLALIMFAGWAIIPITWFGARTNEAGESIGLKVSPYWSIVMIVLPILVSGIFYIIGALREKRRREEQAARAARVEEARLKAQNEVRVQTEEQRKKTLQSKKKK